MNVFILIAVLANPIVLEVPGLTCPTCVPPVKKALAMVDGVNKIEIDWRTRMVSVTVDAKSKLDRSTLAARLETAGYPAKDAGPKNEKVASVPKGDVLFIKDPPQDPGRLSVWGKVTVVAVCTPSCAPCDVFKRDLTLFAQRVESLAVRVVVVDSPKHPAADYMPARADVPYAYVYDKKGVKRYAGGTADQAVYRQVEEILGIKK